ncbi:zinc ribbon domain-containing protein YjdM [Candidatus Berkiella aquae]|uniref:Alkylphosphonate utilization protein n=1 Tax=Candidatus Berkiella aquae TaxID=295108 RepID=A0A0Q9YL48_9GAMM|nr:zinc ribbon domain-containing protein YjdM [Candidatus Berkiella aquae]MCS5710928.1 alkylphosphonate utilization protein [Candidatus Berkiella aquae]
MNTEFPPCPQCQSAFVYADQEHYVCPECGHEWNQGQESTTETDVLVVKDANGNPLQEGDYVTLIKDLKVKGSSSVAKIGTKVKINRLVDGDHDIDCKIEGIGPMMLKSEFVKKL